MSAFVPAQVFHPAEYIRDELFARGWDLDTLTTKALATTPTLATDPEWIDAWGRDRLGWELYMAVAGSADGLRLGDEGAAGLARAFGISAEYWLRTEKLWIDAPLERRSPPPDNEDLLTDEIGESIAAFTEKIAREQDGAA